MASSLVSSGVGWWRGCCWVAHLGRSNGVPRGPKACHMSWSDRESLLASNRVASGAVAVRAHLRGPGDGSGRTVQLEKVDGTDERRCGVGGRGVNTAAGLTRVGADEDERSDRVNLRAFSVTSRAFAIHFSLFPRFHQSMSLYIDMKMILPLNCSGSHFDSVIIF